MTIPVEIVFEYFAAKFQSKFSWEHAQQRSGQKISKQLKGRGIAEVCFSIVLLLAFLIICNSFLYEASAQNVPNVHPASLTILRSCFGLYQEVDREQRQPRAKRKLCSNAKVTLIPIKNCTNGSSSLSNNSHRNRSNTGARQEEVAMSSIYPSSNQSHNEYSLITLSQPANHLSQSRDANSTLNEATERSQNVFSDSQVLTRTKRYIHKAHSSRSPETKVKPETDLKQTQLTLKDRRRVIDKEKLVELVKNGLGLRKLPDMKKANISQVEYSSKYLQYLQRLRRYHGEDGSTFRATGLAPSSLQILSIVTSSFSEVFQRRGRKRRAPSRPSKQTKKNRGLDEKTNIQLHFPLAINDPDFSYEKLVEANVRLMVLFNPALARPRSRALLGKGGAKGKAPLRNKGSCGEGAYKDVWSSKSRTPKMRSQNITLKVFQVMPMHRRRQLVVRKIEFENVLSGNDDETRSQWLEFDVTDAVRGWLNKTNQNLGIEIHCDKCQRIGARVLSTWEERLQEHEQIQQQQESRFHIAPVLNIIGHVGSMHREHGSRQASNHSNNYLHHHPLKKTNQKWPNSCYKAHQRCCRHQLDVAFKDIKGFEFIIQPKIFDAGFCRGRCPPRHNPAHHHALLQSLIWQQDHNRVPRPCCAPSRLTELEILHVDEEHSDKLKISTWKDMQIVECACS